VFSIKDNAITPFRGQFERAEKRFDGAHIEAQRVGAAHLHSSVMNAAEEAGVPTEPIGVFWEKGEAYVGIAHGEEGDRVADMEYGTPEGAPAPVLRAAHRAGLPQAKAHYAHTLINELGF
jgi:hypothetical protein